MTSEKTNAFIDYFLSRFAAYWMMRVMVTGPGKFPAGKGDPCTGANAPVVAFSMKAETLLEKIFWFGT